MKNKKLDEEFFEPHSKFVTMLVLLNGDTNTNIRTNEQTEEFFTEIMELHSFIIGMLNNMVYHEHGISRTEK